MTDLFLTLLSDITSDYTNNETNQFKVKLSPSLYLPGSGWKVSICLCHVTQNFLIQSVNPMCGKKAISERRIYAGGRKQGHVAMGWFFSIPLNPGQLSVRQSMCDQVTF